MFRATNASLEMGLTWGEQYRAKLAKYLNVFNYYEPKTTE